MSQNQAMTALILHYRTCDLTKHMEYFKANTREGKASYVTTGICLSERESESLKQMAKELKCSRGHVIDLMVALWTSITLQSRIEE
jgi:hypothetical protein